MEKKPDLRNLESTSTGHELAESEGYSVAQTYRRFKARAGSSPMAVRRKLLLERAAWTLRESETSVGEIAMDARYDTPDGFTRAFRAAYGVGPREWRKLGAVDYRIGGPGGLHFYPNDQVRASEENPMKLFEQLMQEHREETHRLIDLADRAPNREAVIKNIDPFPWCDGDMTLAQVLERCTTYGEPWLHALKQIKLGETPATAAEHHKRLDQNHDAIVELYDEIETDGAWDLTFVDADCEPPQVFSYGFVMKHLVAFNAYHRLALMNQLRALGISQS